MIDEQKLLDWLTRESTDSTKPLIHRTAYRRLLSKIDNGEFEVRKTQPQVKLNKAWGDTATGEYHRPGDVVWMDDDDIW